MAACPRLRLVNNDRHPSTGWVRPVAHAVRTRLARQPILGVRSGRGAGRGARAGMLRVGNDGRA